MLSQMRKLYLAALAGVGPSAQLIASAPASKALAEQLKQEPAPHQDVPGDDGAENEGS